MPQALTTQQIGQYITQINNGGIDQVRQVYDSLYAQGYNYAGWAGGVASGDSITGLSALSFLQGTALMGLGGEACRNLTQQQIDQIRVDMAKGYLDALQGIAERTGDVVDRDVKFSETEAFHESALQKNGLDLNNWTLKTPFDLIKQTQGDAAAERIWESLRNTGGTGLDAIAESTWILSRTGKEMTSADPERARRAQEWMDTVPGPANWDQMKRFFDILGKLPVPVPDTDPFTGMPWPTPINDIKKKFDKASTIPSPIILDLDGDGVETAAVGAGAYFDHASDGFAEQTGWAGRDDGLLVRDLNGNGSIDNGTELMGSETLLANGQKAANGFEVLKALDQNNDGRIDTSDAVFADLKVWKDANGDGKSSAAELLSLADAGIQSISVGYTNSTLVDANKNEHKQVGSFTTATGQTRTAVDVWFQTDTTRSIATTQLALPADVAALPNVKGFGKVYDLQQAMVRDASGALKSLVAQFTQATSVAQREALLQSIIYTWTGVQNIDPASRAATQIYGNVIGDARKLEALEEFMGEEWVGVWCWGTNDPNPHGQAAPVLLAAYSQLSEMIYAQLAAQSFLKPLYDKVTLQWDAASNSFMFGLSGVAQDIAALINTNRTAGKELLTEFMRSLRGADGLQAMDLVGFEAALFPLGPDVASIVNSVWAVKGTAGNDILTGGAGQDMLQGLGGDDRITGNAGNDILDGGSGNDLLYGNDGIDVFYGGRGIDHLYGGAGVDQYYFGRGDGQDTLHEDYLEDTWIYIGDLSLDELTFRRVGADLLVGFLTSSADNITLADFFKDGEPQSNLVLKRPNGETQIINASALIQLTLVPTLGSDVLEGSSLADTINALAGDDLVFARGGDDIVDGGAGADNINGGEGNDQLAGGIGNDRLYGEAGVDTLTGGDGNDHLFGGAGNDNLTAGVGDDLLDGGLGADTLAGGAGDDAYVIDDIGDTVSESLEEGVDSVSASISLALSSHVENATLSGVADLNATGNLANNLLTGNLGANTLLGLAGDDTLRGADGNDALDGGEGNDMLYGDAGTDVLAGGAGVDRLEGGLGDDSLDGGDGADQLFGQDGTDTLTGGAGADLLEGNDGNDILNGGADGDLLDGGAGADVMRGGLGDDAYIVDDVGDVITEAMGEGTDTVNSSVSITLAANLENLLLVGYGDINATGNADANTIQGSSGANRLLGLAGNDELHGNDGDDVLEGGADNDFLNGGAGADTLAGGLGDDVFIIDRADDLVLESAGEGTDTVETTASYTLTAHVENLVLASNGGYIDGTGNAEANSITGNEYDNRLDGGAGADLLEGGLGNDTYVVDSLADQVAEMLDAGYDTVETGLTYTLGADLERLVLTGTANIDGYGNGANNELIGNSGDNRLDGGLGADTLSGGQGNDVYLMENAGDGSYYSGDRVYEGDNEGVDTIVRSFDTLLILENNVENLTLTGAVVRGNGNELDNVITGNAADNNLLGLGGNDTLIGGGGNDALFGSEGADTLIGGAGDDYYEIDNAADTIVESAGEGDDFVRATVSWTLGANVERLAVDGTADLSVTGNALGNGLWGNAGNNLLTGGAGNDYLVGGAGNDVYAFNRGDGQDSLSNTDVLTATDTLRFGAGVLDTDVLAFQSGANMFLKIKGTTDQVGFINYFGANTVVNGQTNDHKIDRVEFANGVVWDQAMVQTVVDRANTNRAPTVSGSVPALKAKANSTFSYVVAANTITDPDVWDSITYSIKMADGTAVPAWLTFDAATRTMSGTPATGNVGTLQFVLWGTDNYNYSAGTYVNMTIAAPNRTPVLATALADQTAAQGAAFSYTVPGTAFTDPDSGDTLTYTATLADGSALPSWLVFNAATRTFSGTPPALETLSVRVTAKDGDSLSASDIFNVAVSVQNLTLNGTAGADTLNGGTGNDTLNGLAGNDTLNGGAGADNMAGGAGNDTYHVDNAADITTEAAAAGTDTVISSINWTLATNLENLTLSGAANINATGNAVANVLTGNAGDNILSGGAGADTMIGGLGNDTYVVDVATDVVTELANAGTDTVQSSVTLTLGANVENLTLTATTAINGTGNALDNVLTGGSGVNVLTAGAGNDTYIVGTGDTTVEAASAGTDTVQSAIAWTLATNVENLTLTGTGAVNGTGNTSDNILLGNSGVNTLTGNAGNDTLNGGAGADILVGGTGNDSYWLGRGYGLDTITENDATAGNTDVARFEAGIAADQLWFAKTGNNLDVSIIGTADKFTMTNWYLGSQYHTEQFKTSDGKTLLDSQVQNLVNAMAAFAPPAAGQTTLSAAYQTSLAPVIAANWQ